MTTVKVNCSNERRMNRLWWKWNGNAASNFVWVSFGFLVSNFFSFFSGLWVWVWTRFQIRLEIQTNQEKEAVANYWKYQFEFESFWNFFSAERQANQYRAASCNKKKFIFLFYRILCIYLICCFENWCVSCSWWNRKPSLRLIGSASRRSRSNSFHFRNEIEKWCEGGGAGGQRGGDKFQMEFESWK